MVQCTILVMIHTLKVVLHAILFYLIILLILDSKISPIPSNQNHCFFSNSQKLLSKNLFNINIKTNTIDTSIKFITGEKVKFFFYLVNPTFTL
jgi:hypothetical protein